jgi:biopolymer transport protein ExbD
MRLTSRSGRHGSKIELQMTSMIDCVFLLLIFFIVTSSFHKTERELDPAIKVQRTSAAQAASDLAPAIVEIVRGSAGSFVYRVGGREMSAADELAEVLRQFENKIDGAFVRVEDEAPFQMAADAIQACKNARFSLVFYVPLARSR